MAIEIRPHADSWKCPKCGAKQMSNHYVPKKVGWWSGRVTREHLRVTCWCCGYSCRTEVADR